MSLAGKDSLNHFPSNGRKRRRSAHANQPKLNFTTEKRKRHSVEISEPFGLSQEMSHATPTTAEANHKLLHVNSFAAKAGLNNHARKPGQGKKLVIKNRKGTK